MIPVSNEAMPLRRRLTPIGLGCVTFGREIDQAASFAMMDHAWARGIRMFDTAATYAEGASERMVGAWFAARRPAAGSIVVATKILPPYTAGGVEATVRASMERLAPAPLDVLYLHRWDETAAAPETLACLDELVRGGRVRALGMSNVDAACLRRLIDLQRAAGFAPFSILQNNNNVAVRGVDALLREACREHGVAIVTYSPLGAGFLTGKYRAGVAAGTRFAVIPGHQRVYFHPESLRRLDRLEAIAARTGLSQTQLAVAWALHQPEVATVLIGGRSPAQMEQAFTAQSLNDPALWHELDCA